MDEMVPVYLVWIKAGSEVCQQVFEKPAVKAFFADEYGNSRQQYGYSRIVCRIFEAATAKNAAVSTA